MPSPPERRITVAVPLPVGATPVSAVHGAVREAPGTVIIAHGAGAGMDHPFLVGFAAGLRRAGLSTLRFAFPYAEAGRRMPGPAAHAVLTWRAVVEAAREQGAGSVVACGKSYGGRMASMAVAEGLAVERLVYLGYPLHPPGKPEGLRTAHLPAITVPQLFVEGTKDPFIQPLSQFEEAVATCRHAQVAWIEGGGHSFEVAGRKRPADEVGAALAPIVAEFLRG